MADLMTAVTNYKLLEARYGNFMVPALKIKVGGADVVKTMNLIVEEIVITLSLTQAGSAVIRLAGLYDEKSHSFQSAAKTKFKLGTVVEVEIGYLSSTQKVFKGYVAMLGFEFGEHPLLVVTVMDARRLMMSSGKKHKLYNVKNYSDAVKTVLGDYSRLCTPSVDATADSLTEPVSQTTSDYDFISKELIASGRTDREFFVLADKVYFRKPQKVTAPVMSVKYGRELQDLKVDFSYLDLKVEAVGYNPAEQTAVKGEAQAKGVMSQSKIQGQTPVFTVTAPDADSREKAKVRAEAIARMRRDKSCTGSGSTLGLPEIVPGRFLKVEALEKMADQSYYITEVVHTMSGESFLTYFEIGGVK